ncbi:DUF493 family protein YbeD [Thorsellia anophelis]|uniref:UPF0250 protein SAMN02583745_02111 n=1 Tax=Thorsellia anophelis DSM 18579 TaxID=1123402 RepID=A0A1I0DTQ0_9GAMM|nr:DUF493 family protein YbeD [Thorsellia anophelis]SET35581.1 hypothetical protein SAMN02583745_02111 [Thorsellia anophelis DSM 18579]
MKTNLEHLLEFPCDFPFKIMGVASPALVDNVMAIVQKHVPGDYQPIVKPSGKGNYQSVSVMIRATKIEEIEMLYEELGAIEGVKLVL